MSEYIEGIVVASSRKYREVCLVVFEEATRKFYRIISNRSDRKDGELLHSECIYPNGREVVNLDRIRVYVLSKNYINDAIQKENVYIDHSHRIEFLKHVDKKELIDAYGYYELTRHKYIFSNQYSYISSDVGEALEDTFILARVFSLRFYGVEKPDGEIVCKCSFKYNMEIYQDISVTISKTYQEDLLKYGNKRYGQALVCFSIGHKWNDKCYKFLCSFLGIMAYNSNEQYSTEQGNLETLKKFLASIKE